MQTRLVCVFRLYPRGINTSRLCCTRPSGGIYGSEKRSKSPIHFKVHSAALFRCRFEIEKSRVNLNGVGRDFSDFIGEGRSFFKGLSAASFLKYVCIFVPLLEERKGAYQTPTRGAKSFACPRRAFRSSRGGFSRRPSGSPHFRIGRAYFGGFRLAGSPARQSKSASMRLANFMQSRPNFFRTSKNAHSALSFLSDISRPVWSKSSA